MLFLSFVSVLAGMSCFAQKKCNPVVSVQSLKSQAPALKVQHSDTLVVRVSCLEACKVIATSKTIAIRKLDNGTFVVKPSAPGRNKVKVRTDCPQGTKVFPSLDMSGVVTIGEVSLMVEE